MATTVVLRIFFHGLIAMVPMDDGSNQMRALVVDARTVPDEASRCVAAHTPELRFLAPAADCAAAASIGCRQKGPYCICTAVRQEIGVSAGVKPKAVKFNSQPPRRLPKSPAEQGTEFSYMANLLNLPGVTLNPDVLNLKPPPPAVLDRMTFAFDDMETCMLSGKDVSAGHSDVHTFSFGRAGDPSGSLMRQAIAYMMAAKATVPYDGSSNQVLLTLKGFDAATSYTMHLVPDLCDPHGGSTAKCIDVVLNNMRPPLSGMSGCDGTGRDFAFFYSLVNNPPRWEARLVPIDDDTEKIDAKLIEIQECVDHPEGPMNRPICGMASFIQ
jgi:hypothetical protein